MSVSKFLRHTFKCCCQQEYNKNTTEGKQLQRPTHTSHISMHNLLCATTLSKSPFPRLSWRKSKPKMSTPVGMGYLTQRKSALTTFNSVWAAAIKIQHTLFTLKFTINFLKNFSLLALMAVPMLGKSKNDIHSITTSLLFVLNIFIKQFVNTNSNELSWRFFIGQTITFG